MEDKMQYIDKVDISKQLKNRSQTSRRILPRDIDLSIKNGVLSYTDSTIAPEAFTNISNKIELENDGEEFEV
jgi:hypothetical protein